jgi:hypothetical protein
VESELIHSPLFSVACEVVNSGECSTVHWAGQPKMSGLCPARSKKIQKKIFSKIYNSSAYFSTKFCLILICIFTS